MESGSELVGKYSARTTDICSNTYPNFTTKTHLSLAVKHFIAELADATLLDYLLHDRTCRALTWHETAQMEQTLEASRLSLPPSSVTAARPKVGAPFSVTITRARVMSVPHHKSQLRAQSVSRKMHTIHARVINMSPMTTLVPGNRKDHRPRKRARTLPMPIATLCRIRKHCSLRT